MANLIRIILVQCLHVVIKLIKTPLHLLWRHRPPSVVAFKSYFSNKYLMQSCPQSAPASSQTSPSHYVSQYKLLSSMSPTAIVLQPKNMKVLPSYEATERMESKHPQTPEKASSPASKEVKTRHNSVGDTLDNGTSPTRSPRLPGKSSPGKSQMKHSRRHTIASDVTTTRYPEGGFRYMAGLNSLTRPRKSSPRDGISASTGEPSPPPGRAGQRNKGSPKRSSRDKTSQLRSPKF